MVKQIVHFLKSDEWLIGDEDIDFAKGINKLPKTFKEAKQTIKRKYYGGK